jgi:hypothetical protein
MTGRTAVRASLRAVVPETLRWRWHRLRHHGAMVRGEGGAYYLRFMAMRSAVWARSAVAQRAYTRLTPGGAARRRRSHRVFVFGSGYSLNELPRSAWEHFAEHDVLGFSGFIHQSWVRVDYHVVRGWDEGPGGLRRQRVSAEAYARRLRDNARFRETVYLLQGDYGGLFAQLLVADRLLPSGAALCWYRTNRYLDNRPGRSWDAGVSHGAGTLADTVNAAYLLGWREIVLVGVDMYDSRYFWGPPDATLEFDADGRFAARADITEHAVRWNAPHNTATNGMVDMLGWWADLFQRDGVQLSVYNPRSLLTRVLPVYPSPAVGAAS